MTKMTRTDILLLRYAAGTLRHPTAMIVVILLIINAENRRKVAEFETWGGRILQDEPPAPLSSCCLENVLRNIDAEPPLPGRLRRFLYLLLKD